ncbi:uncharacterized protein [Epargyreus clarus]|uniref:uncharacterized protein isoform X2 n=1 Tax=Epargyreus clarus TaxID=520877 RepID=UPI003C2F934C
MNQIDQNINKDMVDSDLIDVESLDFSDDQTWLLKLPEDSGQKVDIIEYNLSCDWPINEDDEYLKSEKDLYSLLDNLLKNDVSIPDKHKFDSRTYVKPKKRVQRPSIQSIVEVTSNHSSMSPHPSLNQSPNKYLTYNKYSNPLGPISPMIRLKTFNVDTNSENSHAVKEYAMKRRSIAPDDDPQLEDLDMTLASDVSERLSDVPFKAINIDLSQPAHNLHNTFNKGLTNIMNERGSLNMYQSGESLMRMSPPSLVSSLLMESSGNFNPESLDSRKSMPSQRDSGIPTSGRDSIDPMMTSMTLSILDEKDMSTSFLSQTTYPDNDSLMDSLPPSLVSSVNSSYIVSNTSKPKGDTTDTNIFSSATFTHLEQSERLLSARPRCQLFNSFTKRDSVIKNCESYTKAREEACQIDPVKVLNENSDNNAPKPKTNGEMSETITLHYSNNKFRRNIDAEKENLESTFVADNAFYKDMEMQKTVELASKNSLNTTLDKQELNEIIQARQKLSLARKALPSEPEKPLPNQVDTSPIKTIQLPNQTITVPRQSLENVSEILSRRRGMNAFEKQEEPARETPKRSATFKKVSPKSSAMDATMVYVKTDEQNMIDINSATLNLIDAGERTLQAEEWGSQERAMVGSSESTGTDTGTFSSSSPPESVPETVTVDPRTQVASTPLTSFKRGGKNELMNIQNTISPIYDMLDDKSYTVVSKLPNNSGMERTYDMHNTTVINSATMVKKTSAKRDILAGKTSPDKKMMAAPMPVQRSPPSRTSPTNPGTYMPMPPPSAVPRKTSLPTSKLRQYSSHKELNRIPGNPPPTAARVLAGRSMVRRGVYASNPALSPTAPAPPAPLAQPQRRDSYTLAAHQVCPAPLSRSTGRRGVYASNPALSPTAPAPPAPLAQPQRRDSYTLAAHQVCPAPLSRSTGRRGVYASNPALSPTAPAPPAPLAQPQRRDSYTLAAHQVCPAPLSRSTGRRGVYASNPALSPTAPAPPAPLAQPQRRDSYTLAAHQDERQISRPVMQAPPALVRQGTETLRRERPQSQLVAPKDVRAAAGCGLPVALRTHQLPPPTTRPYSIAGASQLKVSRPTSVPIQRPAPVVPSPVEHLRPASNTESRMSALPRPSRLPAPRRALRPPSVYSVAPTADMDHY